MADTLQTAIADATAELTKAAGGKVETPVGETTQEETQEETSEESSEESSDETPVEDLSDQELLESKNLYKALKNPETAAAVIAALAQQAGILPKTGEAPLTRREEKAAKREIKDIFTEALGKEYSFLADRLAPAIEAVVEQERVEHETRFAEIQQSNVEREVLAAYDTLAKETKGESKKFETRMAQLSEEVPIGNMNVKTYMQRLYVLASNERKTSPQKVADQIRRNASDAPARLRTGVVSLTESKIPDKKMSLDESIKWAQSELEKGKK